MTRWYRAHVGLVVDAKLGEVALIAECSRAVVIATWHAVLESAAETNDAGRFDTTPRRVAAILAELVVKVEAVFAAFADLGMVEGGHVTAWTRRQFESDSSTERSRKHRGAKASGELMRGHAVGTSPQRRETPPQRDATVMQRCATVPYTETETEDNPPSPSSEAARERFADFWQAMPSPDPAAKPAALTAFARLGPSDQTQAIAAAKRYAGSYSAKPTTHPISPARFLRERCFEGYRPSVAGSAPTVFVHLDTPQWRAWAAHRGKPIPVDREGGWHFPSEWPPKGERGAA